MISLLAAYLIAVVSTGAYVLWLVTGTRRIVQRLRQLQSPANRQLNNLPARKSA
jgi:hypothetical protein